MSATSLKSPPTCRRCGNPLYTGGARGLCLPCLSATTIARFSASEGDTTGDDLRLEEGVTVGPQNRFLLHDKLGAGGMGEVWLATDQELSREDEPHWVALKFLSESIRGNKNAMAAIRMEVIRSQELNHHNIVRVFDLHTTRKGMPFIKMEYVKGNSLSYWLQDCPNGVMRWKDVIDIAMQLCSALQYAHETAGVIHRDIKPGNILLRADRVVKLTDFGIAEALYGARVTTMKKGGLGTLWYASPQQISGQRPTPADDIHALGATLYELLTGTPPFLGDAEENEGDPTDALINQVRYDPPEPIPQRLARRKIYNEIPARLADLIYRCLEKEPQKRPLAREVIAAFQTIKSPAGPAPIRIERTPEPVAAPAAAPVAQSLPEMPQETWEEPATPGPQISRRRILLVVTPIVAALILTAGLVWTLYKVPATSGYVMKVANAMERWIRPPRKIVVPRSETNNVTTQTDSNEQKDSTETETQNTQKKDEQESTTQAQGAVGSVALQFPVLISHPNVSKRTLSIQKADGTEIWGEDLPLQRSYSISPHLPVGRYKAVFSESPSEWRMTVPVEIPDDGTNVIKDIGARQMFMTIKVIPPNAALSWSKGLSDVETSRGTYKGPFWPGTFPVIATASGYKDKTEWVTLDARERDPEKRVYTIVLQNDQYPLAGPNPWKNSLGLEFRQLPSSLFVCVTETRVQDFAKFCESRPYNVTSGLMCVTSNGITEAPDRSWKNPFPAFKQGSDHPVVGVNWHDAQTFCDWLTETERANNFLRPNQKYRLPNKDEWIALAGGQRFPWGKDVEGLRRENGLTYSYAGNYSAAELRGDPEWHVSWPTLSHNDGYRRTAPPVGVHFLNISGLYHVGGNAAEWTSDQYVCGGSWADGEDGAYDWLETRHAIKMNPAERHDRIGFRVVIETTNERVASKNN